jgi:hypothetical protein
MKQRSRAYQERQLCDERDWHAEQERRFREINEKCVADKGVSNNAALSKAAYHGIVVRRIQAELDALRNT